MGVVGAAIKGFGKALKVGKKAAKRVKEDAPYAGLVGTVIGGHHVRKKIQGEPTFVDIGKSIIKKVKKVKKK